MLRHLILLCGLLIAACSPAPTPTPIPPTPTPTGTTAAVEGGLFESLIDDAGMLDERPAWHDINLTDVRTGASFTLANYAGRTLYLQPMSAGCAECFVLQTQVQEARNRLNPDQYIFISVSVDPATTLVDFANARGFDWIFISAGSDFYAGLVETFGASVTDLSGAPHFVISPTGAVSNLSTGQHSADQLIGELTAASGA